MVKTLFECLKAGCLKLDEALDVAVQVASGSARGAPARVSCIVTSSRET
jgi:hypothetical protein